MAHAALTNPAADASFAVGRHVRYAPQYLSVAAPCGVPAEIVSEDAPHLGSRMFTLRLMADAPPVKVPAREGVLGMDYDAMPTGATVEAHEGQLLPADGAEAFGAALDAWADAEGVSVKAAVDRINAVTPSGLRLRPDGRGATVNVHRTGEEASMALLYLRQPRSRVRCETLTRAAWAAIQAIARATA